MHLKKSNALVRSGALLAGAALLVPLASTANAQALDEAWSLQPLQVAQGDYVTLAETLQAPALNTEPTGQEDPNYLLTTPGGFGGGAVMYDNNGQPVWMLAGSFINMEQVQYQGRPALTTFDSRRGAHIVLDQSYNEIATIQLVNQPTDGHDIEFNEDGSRVLVEGWASETVDLSPWGGPVNGTVLNPVIQELDTATGQVLFEWSALDHISPDETMEPINSGFGDLFHINSVSYDSDGNILANFRNTSTVYKIDINTGEIIWRLGGELNDFTFPGGEADMPRYEHDAQRLPDGRLSVFDNGNGRNPQESRGLIYEIDETTMTATVSEDLRADPPAFSPFIGNNRQVGNGNQLVCFGTTGRLIEYADGQPVFTAQFADNASSYRADRTDNWVGTPAAPPDVVVRDGKNGAHELYVSWNGATEVDEWLVEAGPDKDELTTVGTLDKSGFETGAKVETPEDVDVFRVTALDDSGKALDSRIVSTS